jgi:ABC-2 type transport system ATP-binding protein
VPTLSPDVAIRARGVSVNRGSREVLREISFSVRIGSITGLLGPSGSGKTTLMRAVVGVQRRVSGELRVLGQPAGSAGLRRRLGYVTQAPAVYDDLTVRENLAYFGDVVGAGPRDVDDVIDQVALGDAAAQAVRSLSGGQRSRVSLATALLGSPELLVLDEPTVGLDPVLRESLWSLFRSLAADGVTLLVSSHVMDEAGRCDDLLLLRDGRLLEQASPSALAQQTGTDDLERAFLRLIESRP